MPLSKKYVHWLPRGDFEALRSRLLGKKVRMTPIRSVPCKGLSDVVDIGFVMPEEWNKTCRRQGSWYRQSDRNGQILVLSSRPIEGLAAEAVIEPCDFRPPSLPDAAARKALAEDPGYRRRAPAEWFEITDEERRYWDNLIRKIGGTGTLDQVFEIHNANHAAFLKGAPAAETAGGGKAPYSIARSADVCSACVELFDLHPDLRRFPVKYVMPCPGLVLFGKAPRDAYLKVARSDSR